MGKLSKIGPGTEAGKLLLQDFKNWRSTGFMPWGPNVGSAAHYQTRKVYQIVSQSAFRSQAKKIARIALEQMPACDVEGAEKTSDNNEKVMTTMKKVFRTIQKRKTRGYGSTTLKRMMTMMIMIKQIKLGMKTIAITLKITLWLFKNMSSKILEVLWF